MSLYTFAKLVGNRAYLLFVRVLSISSWNCNWLTNTDMLVLVELDKHFLVSLVYSVCLHRGL